MSSIFLDNQRRCSMDLAESKWREELYKDRMERDEKEMNYLSKEMHLRSSSRINLQIYDEELMRAKLGVDRLVLEPRPKKPEDFPELPDDAVELVERVWNLRANREEVFAKGFDVEITRKDLLTLFEVEWLNDEVINFYMNLIVRRNTEQNLPKVYAFSTFFYPNISSKGYASVKRWTRKVDIFSHDLLLIPIHLTAHWCLATVDLKNRVIAYYDSLLGENQRCLSLIRSICSRSRWTSGSRALSSTVGPWSARRTSPAN